MTKRREWWIIREPPYSTWVSDKPLYSADTAEEIHVREIRPGDVTITRDEFRRAFGAAFCEPGNTHKEMDSVLGLAIERQLWPEGSDSDGR